MADISNDVHNTLVAGTEESDVILNNGSVVTVQAKGGNDTVDNYGTFATIDLGAGNDSIYNSSEAKNAVIVAGAGDDTVENDASAVTIDGGDGNDYITNYANNVLIQYSGGNDVIEGFNDSDTLQIVSGSITSALSDDVDATLTIGANTITLKNIGTNTVNVMYSSGSSEVFTIPVSITRTEQAEEISNSYDNATIRALGGNDSIYNGGANVLIEAGAGDDSITNWASNVTIDSGDGNDSIANDEAGNDVSINAGAGDDSITNWASNVTIDSGAGNDYIYAGGLSMFIRYSGGNNVIEGLNDFDTLQIVSGSITSALSDGTDATLTVGTNSITLKNFDASNALNIMNAAGRLETLNVSVILTGTERAEEISNSYDNATIRALGGHDTIINYETGNAVSINAGAGFDSVDNRADNVTIDSGDDNDYVYNTGASALIDGGAGDDYISNNGASTIIDGGDGNDDIYNSGNYVVIGGSYGNDYISNSGDSSTIQTGAGNDSIYNDGVSAIIEAGDGNDFIENIAHNTTLNSGAGADFISVSGDNVTIDAGEGNDSIENIAHNTTISGGAGNDSIYNNGISNLIDGGDGNDTIINNNYNATINAGEGNDIIELDLSDQRGSVIQYKNGDGNDTIYNYGHSDVMSKYYTVKITDGSDVKASIKGNDIILKIGKGSITIKDAATDSGEQIALVDSNDNFLLAENVYTSAGIVRDNKIELSETLKGSYWQGDGITFVDGSQLKNGIEIIGNDTLTGGTLLGGVGKDTLSSSGDAFSLTGGKGDDVFDFGGGNATISDYSTKGTYGADKISFYNNIELPLYTIDANNNLILTDETNTLTIKDGGNKKITFTDDKAGVVYRADGIFDGKEKSATLLAATTYFNANAYSKLVTIDGAEAENAINITGNRKANKIYAGNYGSTLNGGKGNDLLWGGYGTDIFVYENKGGKDTIESYDISNVDVVSLDNKATIKDASIKKDNTVIKFAGGSLTIKDATEIVFEQNGQTTIFSGGIFIDENNSSAKVYSSFKGEIDLNDDYNLVTADASLAKKAISIYGNAEDNSLIGGAGKDSLWGGDGSDTFIYKAGTGNDVIFDYEDGDLLTILDKKGKANSFTDSTFSDGTLTLEINGGGKVSFESVDESTAFNINSETYHISDGKLKK